MKHVNNSHSVLEYHNQRFSFLMSRYHTELDSVQAYETCQQSTFGTGILLPTFEISDVTSSHRTWQCWSAWDMSTYHIRHWHIINPTLVDHTSSLRTWRFWSTWNMSTYHIRYRHIIYVSFGCGCVIIGDLEVLKHMKHTNKWHFVSGISLLLIYCACNTSSLNTWKLWSTQNI